MLSGISKSRFVVVGLYPFEWRANA